MPKKSLEKRLEKLELKAEPEGVIFVCERTDGYLDIPLPGGGVRTITEKQFLDEGGKIVRFGDNQPCATGYKFFYHPRPMGNNS